MLNLIKGRYWHKFWFMRCMKQTRTFTLRLLLSLSIALLTVPAFSQINYFYGQNNRGIRISGGVGVATLATHYNSNPAQLTWLGNLSYDFSKYLSIGIDGQYGTLKGVDNNDPHHLYYTSSTNKYATASFNVRAGLGLITDFNSNNAFEDAVKRLYLGVGYGVMHKHITFTTDPSRIETAYGDPEPYGYMPIVPMNIGTNIKLINVLGYDRLEVNPNFQLTYIPSMYSDGYISSAASHLKGFYKVTSLSVRFKF